MSRTISLVLFNRDFIKCGIVTGITPYTWDHKQNDGTLIPNLWSDNLNIIEYNTVIPVDTDPIHEFFSVTLYPVEPTGNIYIDICGHFPTISIRVHNYIMISYGYENNDIFLSQLKSGVIHN